jgi:hypothetical protein
MAAIDGFAVGLQLADCRDRPCSPNTEVGRQGARREGQLSGRIAKANNRPIPLKNSMNRGALGRS